jgi:NifU-like protein involved in Fe-S cluster formation
MNYSDLTWRRFASAAFAGVLAGPTVRRGAAGSRRQGTWVQFDVQVGSGNQDATVAAVRFLAFGCPHVIAASDWVAEAALGRHAQPLLPEPVQALRERFDVPVEKLGRLLVIEDAWISALSSPYRP